MSLATPITGRSDRDSELMFQTFGPWLAQALPNSAVPLPPQDLLGAVFAGLRRVAAAVNGQGVEVRGLTDDALEPALEERGLGLAWAAGLELPDARLALEDRVDNFFHPSRFRTRRTAHFTRLEVTFTVGFLNAIMTGARMPEGMTATTEEMRACLAAWTARYAFHTLCHLRQGIHAENYGQHAGRSRLYADYHADLDSLIHTAYAYGLPVSADGSSAPDPGVVELMKRLSCCSAFAVRQDQRGAASLEEQQARWYRSLAGRISLRLVMENLAPSSVIVLETPGPVPVIVNQFRTVIKGTRDRDTIAEAVVAHYREHLQQSDASRELAAQHLQTLLASLEAM